MIIKWLKRLNQALLGLILGILIYGVLVELIGVWFVGDKLHYTTGLLIGTACAVGMAIHIAMIIEESVSGRTSNSKLLSIKSVARYLIVCVVLIAMAYFKLGNIYTALMGLLGLKVSAYAQPLLNKVFFKEKKDEPAIKIK